MEAVLVGGLQLLGGGNDGTVLQAGPLRPVKVQRVARGDGSVMEHNACKTHAGGRAGQAQPPVIKVLEDLWLRSRGLVWASSRCADLPTFTCGPSAFAKIPLVTGTSLPYRGPVLNI